MTIRTITRFRGWFKERGILALNLMEGVDARHDWLRHERAHQPSLVPA